MAPANKGHSTAATERALARVKAGERPTQAARAEGIAASTVWRALARQRPKSLFLVMTTENNGTVTAWIEDQNYRERSERLQFVGVAHLQAQLPALIAKTATVHAA